MSAIQPKRGPLRRFFTAVVLLVNILVCLALIVCAWGSYISPETWRYAPFGPMLFPCAFIAVWGMLVIDLVWWRRMAVMVVLSMLACYPQMWDFAPLHLPKGKMDEAQQARSFTLMTYNVFQFENQDKQSPRSSNEQLDYILDVSPDILCIEESHCLSPNGSNKITQEQLADLGEMYPYIYIDTEQLALMSKFEAKPIHIDFPSEQFGTGNIGAWRLDVHGQTVNLFVVHLRSYGLSPDDRSLFKEMTRGEDINRSTLREARSELLPKVTSTASERIRQVELLLSYLKKYGGETAIVCGDFNAPVGCYELHMLEDQALMHQAYTEVGFGPMITYNANHFLFRIDHILYRGNLTPWSITRGGLRASDHYPLMVTMLVDEPKP